MKKHFILLMLATAALSACNNAQQTPETIIGRNELKITDGILNADILNSFARLSDPQVSPDGNTILYGVSYPNIVENRSNRELFVVNVDGTNRKQITCTPKSEHNARWIADG